MPNSPIKKQKNANPQTFENDWSYDYGPAPLSPSEFSFFSRLILEKSGIEISRDKIDMMESRLRKRLTALGLTSYGQYKKYLHGKDEIKELGHFVNSLTTNKTEFFREQYHFEVLSESIKKDYKHKVAYIWSAACSSGEEVYSLAMLCKSISVDFPAFDYKILGSDIDTERVKFSSNGIYDAESLSTIPKSHKKKHFDRITDWDDIYYRVNDKYRRNVKFIQHNLIDSSDRVPLMFDYIFLRNVLFYFSKNTAEKVVAKLVSALVPGGLIFVGLTETLEHMDVGVVKIGASVYQKEDDA